MSGHPKAEIGTIKSLQHRLELRANPKTKAWWENYLKHAIAFRGVKMADIRVALHQWVHDEGIAERPLPRRKDLALDLIRLDYCEDKLAGILFLQEILSAFSQLPLSTVSGATSTIQRAGDGCDWQTPGARGLKGTT